MPTIINNQQTMLNETQEERTAKPLGTKDIPNSFIIEEAIIHILDKGGDEPVLNEYVLELSESVYAYINKTIDRCFKSNTLKFGKFNPQINTVKDASLKFLRNEENIIDTSKQIGNILFAIMKANEGIDSCDLLTVSLNTNLGQLFGIIKLDYADNFIHNVDFLDEKISIAIEPVKTGLPDAVKKAAFININNNDFDLYYIDDYKKNKDNSEYNVFYWANHFLNCEEISNTKTATLDFLKASENWVRTADVQDVKETENIRRKIREKIVEEDSITISELADEIFEDADNKEDFKEYMSCLNFEDEIKIDKPTVLKKLNKIKIQIEKDIVLNITRDAYNDNSKFEVIANDDGSVNMILKNITSYVEK